MQNRGINIALPLINEAKFDFIPDESNNRIIFSLKSLNGIGDDVARAIIDNRPYNSLEEFCKKMIDTKLIGNAQMIQLIKAGCFTELHSKNREETMKWYIEQYIYSPSSKLTMSQYNHMVQMGIIPETYHLAQRMINFKKYVLDDEGFYSKYIEPGKKIPQKGYHDRWYILDQKSQTFFKEHFSENSIVAVDGEYYVISEKLFTKEIDLLIQPLKDWFNTQEALDLYNNKLFEEKWQQYAKGNIASWEMDSLCFYYSFHELKDLNYGKYGVVNFFDLQENPEPYDYYTRYYNGVKTLVPKNKIDRIAGTVLDSNNNRHTVTLLTRDGVVECKFSRGQYVHYSKRLTTKLDPNSEKKTVVEDSWFKRGTKLLVCGYRQDSNFRVYKYNDTIYSHTVNKITSIDDNGVIDIQYERAKI